MSINFNNNTVQSTTIKNTNNYKIILCGFMILAIIGCFLPYLTASAYGYSETMNYIYYDGSTKDGVYVVAALLTAFSAFRVKNYKGAVAGIGIGIGVFVFDFIDIQNSAVELTRDGLINIQYGIGFYLVALGLVGALIMIIILSKLRPTYQINNMAQQSNYNVNEVPSIAQEVLTCRFCGNVRNEGMFCKHCGGRYEN